MDIFITVKTAPKKLTKKEQNKTKFRISTFTEPLVRFCQFSTSEPTLEILNF